MLHGVLQALRRCKHRIASTCLLHPVPRREGDSKAKAALGNDSGIDPRPWLGRSSFPPWLKQSCPRCLWHWFRVPKESGGSLPCNDLQTGRRHYNLHLFSQIPESVSACQSMDAVVCYWQSLKLIHRYLVQASCARSSACACGIMRQNLSFHSLGLGPVIN